MRFLGFVPIEVLRIFYDEAKVFVFPSLYEGFGLPPLEAMVHGTPVVTSNVSSLPEVVGNAAVLVNPENVFEIMRALHRVLMDQALRDRMKERGYQQAAKFSWEKSVRRILEAYGQIAHHGASPSRLSSRPPTEECPGASVLWQLCFGNVLLQRFCHRRFTSAEAGPAKGWRVCAAWR